MSAETAYHGGKGRHFAAQVTDNACNADTGRLTMRRRYDKTRQRPTFLAVRLRRP